MALQSSGQIKLSEIAAEFGGSAPHSLSEYYSGGSNVPAGTQNASSVTIPTSGQISLASSFYGSVAEVVLINTTITSAIRTQDAKIGIYQHGFSDGTGTGGVSFGSITSNSISSSGNRTLKRVSTGGSSNQSNHVLTFAVSQYTWTGWTKVVITKGSIVGTLLRADLASGSFGHGNLNGTNLYSGNLKDANGNNITAGIFVNGQTTNFKIIQ